MQSLAWESKPRLIGRWSVVGYPRWPVHVQRHQCCMCVLQRKRSWYADGNARSVRQNKRAGGAVMESSIALPLPMKWVAQGVEAFFSFCGRISSSNGRVLSHGCACAPDICTLRFFCFCAYLCNTQHCARLGMGVHQTWFISTTHTTCQPRTRQKRTLFSLGTSSPAPHHQTPMRTQQHGERREASTHRKTSREECTPRR